ncbi:MAG: hypothetical protein B6243_08365 [Anaerolineaceae bacterium 4572_5.2]|nr:MAG: hypothetical protein B6243_08365 [Anaerolineaceae bacterium 4572_5.2]
MKLKNLLLASILALVFATACQLKMPKLPGNASQASELASAANLLDVKCSDNENQIIPFDELTREEINCFRDDPKSLVLYTALKEQHLEAFRPLFAKSFPDMKVVWLGDSTGNITRRLIDEKDMPVADVVWGVAASSLLLADAEGVIEAHTPANLSRVNPLMRDELDPPHWVGIHAFATTLCINPREMQRLNLPTPLSWQDLRNPIYRNPETGAGYLVMPNPGKSGTGYAMVSGWIQIYGEEEAWALMDELHPNMREYTSSGRAPCNLVADGVYPLGLSFVSAATDKRREGFPVISLLPEEGVGWDVEANAKVLKPDTKELANDFLDWAISDGVMYIDAQFFPLTSVKPAIPPSLPLGYPRNLSDYLIPQNFSWRTANYKRITDEWLKRYRDQSGPSSPQLELPAQDSADEAGMQ